MDCVRNNKQDDQHHFHLHEKHFPCTNITSINSNFKWLTKIWSQKHWCITKHCLNVFKGILTSFVPNTLTIFLYFFKDQLMELTLKDALQPSKKSFKYRRLYGRDQTVQSLSSDLDLYCS